MKYKRLLNIDKYTSSAFLFGARMTGKTSLLRQIESSLYVDLLDPEVELRLRARPSEFWESVQAVSPKQTIIVDEIQRVPSLLDYVQMGIDKYNHRFLLSGSSARKLKRGAANLLGGRALDLRLYPLTHLELENDFDLKTALSYGTLPKISLLIAEGAVDEAKMLLKSYYTTYIKEEVQAEALVRNLSGFQRFLPIAASTEARQLSYANIGRDSLVPDSTVKDFFSILEDTLVGMFLFPYSASERKKTHPKFYLFDCGITRMLLNRLNDPPTGQEIGLLFESWFINEVSRLRAYNEKSSQLFFWRDKDHEVDLLIHSYEKIDLAVEIKAGVVRESDFRSLLAFKKKHKEVPVVVASMKEETARKTDDEILILPWKQALDLVLEKMR